MQIKEYTVGILNDIVSTGLEGVFRKTLDDELASEQELIDKDTVLSTEEKIAVKRKSIGFYLLTAAVVLAGFATLKYFIK